MKKSLLIAFITLVSICSLSAQSDQNTTDLEAITATLNDYIDGTSNGEIDRLKQAFHPDFNLYTVVADTLRIRNGAEYISYFKEGEKNNRKGKILAIDHENYAATAKVEIEIPDRAVYIDYFLLLKYRGAWKIVHKSYTQRFH
ncbi:nuclear transport factor 2 family protein [Jejudonia soesokkakensis]|uniref:Nuclear transport factor 2 family protein n=1 Tax=Jejudonia soesokkakensis TaxID=1323432 RepID=A0ABW2MXZ5_9FLAO